MIPSMYATQNLIVRCGVLIDSMSRQFNASSSASEDMVSLDADRVGCFDLLVSCRAVKLTHSNHWRAHTIQ